MQVTMYYYIHLLSIYYHYMYHFVADEDMRVSVMCIRRQALIAHKAIGIGSIGIPQPTQASAL